MIVLAGVDGVPHFPGPWYGTTALFFVPTLFLVLSVYAPMEGMVFPRAWSAPARASFWRKLLWGVAFALVSAVTMVLTWDLIGAPGAPMPSAADIQLRGFIGGPSSRGWLLAVASAAVLIPIVARGSSRPAMFERYPEFRQPNATRTQQFWSAVSWAVYLFGYEVLFRAYILALCIDAMGLVAGICAHTAFYVVAHLHKPAGETLACFLMGPLFAIIMLNAGIVPVWLLHLCIAVVGEQMSGRSNPATRWT